MILKKEMRLKNVVLTKKELNDAYLKVMYWFFSFPNLETGLNDLSSELKISKTTAKRVIEDLVNDDFLIKKIYGNTWRISCNQKHIYNLSKKIVFNLSLIYEAYEAGLRNQIFELVGNAKAIILFGSYRKGDDTRDSDLDIAIEVDDNQDLKIIELGLIPKFGFRTNVSVNLHIFSRNKIDLNLFSNIANGIILEGYLEVRV